MEKPAEQPGTDLAEIAMPDVLELTENELENWKENGIAAEQKEAFLNREIVQNVLETKRRQWLLVETELSPEEYEEFYLGKGKETINKDSFIDGRMKRQFR